MEGRGQRGPSGPRGSQQLWTPQRLEITLGDAGAPASFGLHRRESLRAGLGQPAPALQPRPRLGVAGPAPTAAASRVSGSLPAPTGLSWAGTCPEGPVARKTGTLTLRVPGPRVDILPGKLAGIGALDLTCLPEEVEGSYLLACQGGLQTEAGEVSAGSRPQASACPRGRGGSHTSDSPLSCPEPWD